MLGILKILVLVLFCVGCVCANTYSVRIDTEHHVNVIDSRFLSFTIDPKYLFSNNENYKSKECMCMASSLSPAFLRIAGPSTSTLTFRNHSISLDPEDPEVGDLEESAQSVFHDVVRENLAGLIKKRFDRFKRQEQPTEVSQGQWKGFARWAKSSGFQLVFALNHDERTAAGLWDPNTAASILTMANRDNIDDIYWQLGYECKNQSIEEYLNDLETLRVITDTFPNPHKWKLVGGDVTGCLHHDSKSDFRDYVTLSCDMMDAVMLNGNSSTFELERMSERDRNKLLKVLSESTTPLWLSEKAWSEELGELSRAADWLTSLGHAAKNGFSVHFRELGATEMYQPTLSFYMALLFKNLVGDKVLDVSMEPEHAILFAHCTSLRRRAVPGAVTLFGANLDGEPARMAVNMGRNDGGDVLQFVIGLDDTGNIVVNDRPMYFERDIKPVVKRVRPFKTLLINLPPKSFGFWVLANTKVKACYNSTDQDHNDVESIGTENVVKERNVSNDNESIEETNNSRNSPISSDDDKQIKDKLFKKHKKYYKHIESSGIDTVHKKVKKRSIDFDDYDVTTESIDFQDENDILNISSKLLQNRIDNLNEDLINMYDTFKDKNTRAKRGIDPTEQRKMRLEKLRHKMLSRKPKVKIARRVTRKNATIPFKRNIFRTKLLKRVDKPPLMIKQKYIRKINDQEKKNADIVKVRNRRTLIKRTSEHQAQLFQEENPDKNLKSYWGLPEKFKLNKALVLLPQDDEDDTPFKERSEESAEDNEEKIETFQKQIKVQPVDSISVNEGYPIEKVLTLNEYKIPDANKTGPNLFLPAGRDTIDSSEGDDATIVPIKYNISKKPEFEKVMELIKPTIEYYDADKMRLIQNNFNKIKVSHESNDLSEIYTPIASTRPIIEFNTPEDKPYTLPGKFVQKNIFENVPEKEHEKHKPKISKIQHKPTEHYVPLYKPDLELYEPGEKKLNLDIPKETTTETNYNVVQTTNKVRTTNKVQTSDQEEPKDKAFELFQTLRRLYKTGGQEQNDNQLEEKILKILKKKEKLLDVYKPTHEQHSRTKHPAEYRPAQNKVVNTERYVPMMADNLDVNEFKQHKMMGDSLDVNEFKQHKTMGDRLDVNEFKQHKMMGDRLNVNEFKQHKTMGDRLDVSEFKQHKMMGDRLDVNEFKQHKMMGDRLDVNEFKQHKTMDDRLDVNEFEQHKMMGDRLDVNEFKQHNMMGDRLDVNEVKQHETMDDRLDVNEFKQHKMMGDRLDVNEFKQHKMMGDRLDVNEFKQHKMMGDRLDVNEFKQHKTMGDRLDVNELKQHKMMGDRLDVNELKQHKMMGDRLDVNERKQHKMMGDRLDVNEFKQHKFNKINSHGYNKIERLANLRTEEIPEYECQESLRPVYSHELDKKPNIATVDIFKSAFKAMVDTILDINSNVKIVWKSLNLMSK